MGLRISLHYNFHLCFQDSVGFGTQYFGGFPSLKLYSFWGVFKIKVAAATLSSSEVCWEAVKIPAAQLLSNMSHREHGLHQFRFKCRVHLKVLIQLFKANLNFVLTQEITSPSVTTVNEKNLMLIVKLAHQLCPENNFLGN